MNEHELRGALWRFYIAWLRERGPVDEEAEIERVVAWLRGGPHYGGGNPALEQ